MTNITNQVRCNQLAQEHRKLVKVEIIKKYGIQLAGNNMLKMRNP